IHERGDACSGEVPAGVEAEQGRVRRWRIRQQSGRDRADDEDEAGKHRIGGAGAQPQQHDGSDTDDDADGLSRTGRGRGGPAQLPDTPTEVTTHAAPSRTGPSVSRVSRRLMAASSDPPIAHGRRRPIRSRVRSENRPATGAMMTPASPPAESTSPDHTTPSI